VPSLVSDTRREIERLKAVMAETNLLVAHSRALISSTRDLLAMLEHDRDAKIPNCNAPVAPTLLVRVGVGK
jgi:hypothetical protein